MSNLFFLASLIGYIGILLLFIQVTIGSRHVFKYWTRDNVFINKIHKQIGIWGTLFIFAHPVLEMMVNLQGWAWVFIPNTLTDENENITYGRVALILVIFIWLTSAIIREKVKWRPWKYIHLFSYPVLLLAFIHIPEIGTYFKEYIFIQVIWFMCFFVFGVSFVLRLLALSSISKEVYLISKKELVGENILLISLKPANGKIITGNIGQHFYLQTDRFLSEHPFTVMEQNKETGELTFGIRKLGKTFERLTSKNIGDKVFVDGPYGNFTREAQNNESKVVISGGIGVTPFVDLVRRYGSSITYINCNRNINEVIRREVLVFCKKYIDVVDVYDGEPNINIKVGRISADLIKEIVGTDLLNQKYFLCGSPMFISIVKGLLVSLSVPKKNIYFEELGF